MQRNLREKYGELYREYRAANPKHFHGWLTVEQQETITRCVRENKPIRILDYGSGNGLQYLAHRQHEPWGILPHCYDPGVPGLDGPPAGRFQGIICTDVLEHIAEDDLPAIMEHIVELLDRSAWCFVYFHVSCLPAKKTFADGRNVHLTIKPTEWWDSFFNRWWIDRETRLKDRPHMTTLAVTYEY